MCGIAGIFITKNKVSSTLSEYQQRLGEILAAQSYRGPDFEKVENIHSANHYLLLGHNRLSIIDLTSNSNQPMWDETRRYCIAYNGMIYNFQILRQELTCLGYNFFSQGDTEVVLKAFMQWGTEAFNKFNGMFAIVIYDSQEEKLFFIRDRLGVKPLYYCQDEGAIYFASTSAELAAQLGLQPNFSMITRGIHAWCYEYENESIYSNLFMVAPSELIVVDYKNTWRLIKKKYYCLADRVSSLIMHPIDTQQQIEKTEYLLQDAIKLRLHAETPLAISLSGGIDSSLIAAFAKKELSTLTAYTFGSLENDFSEAKTAYKAAEAIDMTLNFVHPSAHEMEQAFWHTLNLQDAPFPNLSVVAQYLVFRAAHEQGVKVMLGGQGADETFMGYRKYLLFYLQKLIHGKKYFSAINFLKYLLPCLMQETLKANLFNIKRYTKSAFVSRWGQHEKINLRININEPLWKRQYQDVNAFSLPTLLRYEDRNSMGNSIESRLPFLDYRLVEWALSLPDSYKLHKGYSKWILRQIAEPLVPKNIVLSRLKRGFDVENKIWITRGLGRSFREILNENPQLLKQLGLRNNLNKFFNDDRLVRNPTVLAECIALVWLAQKKHFIWD